MANRKKDAPILVRPDYEFQKGNLEIRYKEFRDGTNLHWHDYYEMEIIVGGEGSYSINGVKHSLSRGSAYLVTPVDFHLIEGDFKLYNLAFHESMLSEEARNHIVSVNPATVVTFSEEEFAFLESALSALQDEYAENAPMREQAMKALLDLILIRYLRKIESSEENMSRSDVAVMRVVSYIKFNFKKKLTLAEAAKAVYLTPNYVGEIFAKRMGVSFNAYLMQTRLNYAKSLLMRGDRSIEEVAADSGFGSQTYFSDCFKKQFGYTPTAVKKGEIPDDVLSEREESEII